MRVHEVHSPSSERATEAKLRNAWEWVFEQPVGRLRDRTR